VKNDAILNIDLDFFTEPCYTGNGYLDSNWQSYTSFQAKAKNWLNNEDFFKKINLNNRVRGCSIGQDDQVPFYYNKIIKEGYISPLNFDFIHIDAHHDMYSKYNSHYYKNHELANYNNWDSLISLFINRWVKKVIWVYPDYYNSDFLNKHLFFREEVEEKNGLYFFNFVQNTNIEIKPIKWSDFNADNYVWKYISLILNSNISKIDNELLIKIRSFISQW